MVNSNIEYYWEDSSQAYDVPTIESYDKSIKGGFSNQMTIGVIGTFILSGLISLSVDTSEPIITYQQPNHLAEFVVYEAEDLLDQEIQQQIEIWKDEVSNLASLKDNWDNEGASRMSTKSISNVLSIIGNKLSRPELISDVYPNQNGFVSVEWRNSSNDILGLEVGRKLMSYFTNIHNVSKYYNRIEINEMELGNLYKRLNAL